MLIALTLILATAQCTIITVEHAYYAKEWVPLNFVYSDGDVT